MLSRLKIECFQYLLDLELGDRWQQELYPAFVRLTSGGPG